MGCSFLEMKNLWLREGKQVVCPGSQSQDSNPCLATVFPESVGRTVGMTGVKKSTQEVSSTRLMGIFIHTTSVLPVNSNSYNKLPTVMYLIINTPKYEEGTRFKMEPLNFSVQFTKPSKYNWFKKFKSVLF